MEKVNQVFFELKTKQTTKINEGKERSNNKKVVITERPNATPAPQKPIKKN